MNTTKVRLLSVTLLGALTLGLSACGESSEAETESATRTVTDATGSKVEVPAEPKAVVTLHYAATQPALDLGVTPAGQGNFEPGIIPEERIAEVEEVPVVTTDTGEADLEKIAGVDPDLIFAPNTTEEETLNQLEEIAPVYVFTLRGGERANWPLRTTEIADALGRTDEAEQLATDFEARQKKIAETYAEVTEGKTVAVIDAFEDNNFYAWGAKNMQGSILIPLGFTWSAQEEAIVQQEMEGEDAEATVSFEKVGSVVGDADILFIGSNLRDEVNPFMASLQKTELYQQLPAVKAGQAYVAGKNTVAGYTDANYTLDKVEEALEDVKSK